MGVSGKLANTQETLTPDGGERLLIVTSLLSPFYGGDS